MELRHLDIGYKGRGGVHRVATDITAHLPAGSLTCLLGPNGSGKSTLLRTMAGAQPPLAGQITLESKTLTDYAPQELARQVSIVLTTTLQDDTMCVHELVALGRSPYTNFYGRLTPHDYDVAAEAMHLVGVTHLADRRVRALSDGERQKVMIAKSIAQQTPVILLDEPTAFLDFPSKVEAMVLLRRLAHEQHKAILLSTHDMEIALQVADNLWVLAQGHPFCQGTPACLSTDGTLHRIFSTPDIHYDAVTRRFEIQTP